MATGAGWDVFTILTVRVFVVAAALSLCLAGCASAQPAPEAAPTRVSTPAPTRTQPRPEAHRTPEGEVGDTVSFRDGSTAGTITLKRIERIPAAQGGRVYARPAHGSFLVAHFRLAITQGSGLASELAFQAQTSDGTTYQAASGVVQAPINPHKVPVPAGHSTRGDVAFDVPEGDLLISYAPTGEPLASFEVTG
jgi:hypothetical protein